MATHPRGKNKPRLGHAAQPTVRGSSPEDGTHRIAVYSHNPNQSIIHGAGVIINYNPITTNVGYSDVPTGSDAIQIKILTTLKSRHVAQAVYGAQIGSGCMEGTRVQILRDIETWIKDTKGPQIFWLAGMAGTGKSAIAWTVCSRASDDPEIILGGSFFCSRSTGLSTQRDVRCVVPTLAQLMARQSVAFSIALAAELTIDPDVLHQQVGVQVDKLLYKPLLALKDSPLPVVFVIDAVDECGGLLTGNETLDDAETHRIVSDMLEALVTFSRSTIKLPVKFLVTSRPETHIRDTHVSDVAFSKVLRLHTVDKQLVTADVRFYISNRLFSTPTLRALFNEHHVEALVRFCDGLFIIAATALQHALGAGVKVAAARFDAMLKAIRNRLTTGATAPLDRIYAVILEDAAKEDEFAPEKLRQLTCLLAALLSARMTLSVAALAQLLDLSTGQVRATLSGLHAVVHVPDNDDEPSLRPLHASFGDYLFGRAPIRIRVSESQGHEALADGCLNVLAKYLRFNVSNSLSSFDPNPAEKPDSITLSLEYACLHWIYHISGLLESSNSASNMGSTIRSRFLSWIARAPLSTLQSRLDERIRNVFRPRFLYWLEIMSVLGQVQRAAAMLIFAAATVRARELSRFFRDANSFVASSHKAIELSAPHIYLSALPFADKDSLVHRDFCPLHTGLVTVDLLGVSHHAGRLVMSLTGHEGSVNAVVYSPDSRLLASASADSTVRIWDMRTGEEIMAPLRSNNGAVWSVDFSPDGKSVVSGTEASTVCVWSLETPQAAPQRLEGHSKRVSCVLFSPNAAYIASAALDKTVRLWSAKTFQQLAVLHSHTLTVSALSFAPDSLTLSSGSEDGAIQHWVAGSGRPKYESQHRHNRPIDSVCFLPDGQKIAASSGKEILLCLPKTGKKTATLHTSSTHIMSVRASQDGQSLVSTYDKSVCITTLPRFTTKTSSLILDGHTALVRSAVFSPDSLYIASASDDRTIRVWNASGNREVLPPAGLRATNAIVSARITSDCRSLTGHDEDVLSIAVSSDGKFIVSGSGDHSVRRWAAQTGTVQLSPLFLHRKAVFSVAMSASRDIIASGSGDQGIKLSYLTTGEEYGSEKWGHRAAVRSVALSRDGEWLASGSSDKSVCIWKVHSESVVPFLSLTCNDEVHTVAFSLPYNHLVAAGDISGRVHLWGVGDGRPSRRPINTGLPRVYSIGFSPDGARIVAGGRHLDAIKPPAGIWDIATGEQVVTLSGHSDTVFSVAYSSDGRFICSGSGDQTVRLWDPLTGAQIARLSGHSGSVQSVAFTSDGRHIVSGSRDKTIRIWSLTDTPWTHLGRHGDIVAALDSAVLKDGWLQGPSGELLLWVPTAYHKYLISHRDSSRRIKFSVGTNSWHRGESWISCFRKNASDLASLVM